MRVPSRRTSGAVAAPVLTALSLVALAACGGSDGGKTAPDALDRGQLQAALLTQAELPQGWTSAGGGEAVQDDEIAQADRSACQPLLDMVSGRAEGIAPTGQVDTGLLGPDEAGGAAHLGINQYKEGKAAELLDAAKAAVPGCAAFGVRQQNGGAAPAAVTAGQAPALGDASLYFELAMTAEDGTMKIPYTVVRKGSALVITSSLNAADQATAAIPEAILKAQVDKLTQAQAKA